MRNYLYNGIELPELPELPHLYALIFTSGTDGSTNLVVMPDANGIQEFTIITVNYLRPIYGIKINDSTRYGKKYVLTNDVWVETDTMVQNIQVSRIDADGNEVAVHNIFWSNYDIPNEVDGTLYLAASDPVPVGGVVPDIPPLPLWLDSGWARW